MSNYIFWATQEILRKRVVRLGTQDENGVPGYGSGFVVFRSHRHVYIITAKHVIKNNQYPLTLGVCSHEEDFPSAYDTSINCEKIIPQGQYQVLTPEFFLTKEYSEIDSAIIVVDLVFFSPIIDECAWSAVEIFGEDFTMDKSSICSRGVEVMYFGFPETSINLQMLITATIGGHSIIPIENTKLKRFIYHTDKITVKGMSGGPAFIIQSDIEFESKVTLIGHAISFSRQIISKNERQPAFGNFEHIYQALTILRFVVIDEAIDAITTNRIVVRYTKGGFMLCTSIDSKIGIKKLFNITNANRGCFKKDNVFVSGYEMLEKFAKLNDHNKEMITELLQIDLGHGLGIGLLLEPKERHGMLGKKVIFRKTRDPFLLKLFEKISTPIIVNWFDNSYNKDKGRRNKFEYSVLTQPFENPPNDLLMARYWSTGYENQESFIPVEIVGKKIYTPNGDEDQIKKTAAKFDHTVNYVARAQLE